METILLSDNEPEFTITGREEKMSVEILKVTIKDPFKQDLKLNIIDENGFLLYSKMLIPEPKHPNTVLASQFPEVAVNKRFIFSASLKVNIEVPAGSSFSVEVHYV